MNLINRAFIELMLEGDAEGRGFQYPIPTYNITKDFDWDSENSRLLFEMTAKYGTPYFQNFINSDLDPSDVRSMCCRLQLDKRELRKRGGGLFGSDEFTGSVGVVTINLPRIAYLSGSKVDFFRRLTDLMDTAAQSLVIKRKVIDHLMKGGLFPYSRRYLGHLNNHFSTIGIVGMNECALNFLGKNISTEEGSSFAEEILDYMRRHLADLQEDTGDLFNLEATPAESTSYRLAKHDKEQYPDIITSGEKEPFYTNSTQLPVDQTNDVFEALDHQDKLQTKYTGGTVFHAFLGEAVSDWKACRSMVQTIARNYHLPYFTISPTFSICPDHGYIAGEHFTCPHCGGEAEVYTRIVGYYRSVRNWNKGKQEEFGLRELFDEPIVPKADTAVQDISVEVEEQHTLDTITGQLSLEPAAHLQSAFFLLFYRSNCPNCPPVKAFMEQVSVQGRQVNVDTADGIAEAAAYSIMAAPTVLFFDKAGNETVRVFTVQELHKLFPKLPKLTKGNE